MARNLGINIRIGADLKKFSKDMQNVQRQMKRTARSLKRSGQELSRSVSLPLGLAGAAMIKFASDTQESLNKVDVAFGSSSKQVKDFADTTLKSFGIARGSALDMAATFGDMGTSMGLTQSQAADMSTKLVGLAGDLASFKNIRIDIAQTALNSIFTGETESLKKLGIVMTQANLSAFALEQGIKKPFKAMSEAEKTMLRYQFVMAKTSNAHGDFERTGGGAANQMRIFQESLKELADDFGQIILPAFTKIITKVNAMVKSFSSMSEGTKKVILVVAGLAAALGPLMIAMSSVISAGAKVLPMLSKMALGFGKWLAAIGPVGWAIIGVTAAVAAAISIYKSFNKETERLTEAQKQERKTQKELSDAYRSAAIEAGAARIKLMRLNDVITDNTIRESTRRDAISKLRMEMPEYLNQLSDEELLTKGAVTQIDMHVKALKRKALALAFASKAQDAANRLAALEYQKATRGQRPTTVSQTRLTADGVEVMDERALEQAQNFFDTQSKTINEGIAQAEKDLDLLMGLQQKYEDANSGGEFVFSEVESKLKDVGDVYDELLKKGHIDWLSGGEDLVEQSEELDDSLKSLGETYDDLLKKGKIDWLAGGEEIVEQTTSKVDSLGAAIQKVRDDLKYIAGDLAVELGRSLGNAVMGVENAFDNLKKALLDTLSALMRNAGLALISTLAPPNIALGLGLLVASGFTSAIGSNIGAGNTAMTNGPQDIMVESTVRGEDIVLVSSRNIRVKSRTR